MTDPNRGYLRERFPDLKGDSFNCGICSLVCKDPKECEKCGAMFCTYCIDERTSIKNECPIGCLDAKTNIKPIGGALAKIYRNVDVHCKYADCKRIVKLCELAQHEAVCQLPKCQFFHACGNYLKASNVASGVCDPACGFLKAVQEANGDWTGVYESIKNFLQSSKMAKVGPYLKDSHSITDFKWNAEKIGQKIQLTNERRTIFLQDNSFIFHSVVADKPMLGGVHYWEIHADSRTEYELKVGVSLTADFDHDTCFSDQEFGFAYYGLGQLRNGSNSSGLSFGRKFRREGVLGVCLNMNKGTLSFALNGEYIGRAFKVDALKRGPVYPAVSMVRLAGCTLVTGKSVPDYFKSC